MSAEIECKKMFAARCLRAMLLSIGTQYALLTVFLIFVNINFLSPISWVTGTLSLILSFYTWICSIPLIFMVIIYEIVLGNSCLAPRKFYSTRFTWMCRMGLRKILYFGICSFIGFLTAWLYSRFLHDDYRFVIVERFGNCLNLKFLFLALIGIYTGIYFFIKERLMREPGIKFPIIQECMYIKIRSRFFKNLCTCLIKSFTPTICYAVLFWLLGVKVSENIGDIFGVKISGDISSLYSPIKSVRIMLYAWILSSQILCNFYLIDDLFNILITQPIQFEIEKNKMIPDCPGVTLTEVLALSNLPVAQHLASLDLYNITSSTSSSRRQVIFSLSVPGGHPYNWNQLTSECMVLIEVLREELTESMKHLSPLQDSRPLEQQKKTASEVAKVILRRQFDESVTIRRMMSQECEDEKEIVGTRDLETIYYKILQTVQELLYTLLRTTPGFNYLFGGRNDTKLKYILAKSQYIVWIAQSLAGFCEKSLHEDNYGVSQPQLPHILKSLLNLKITLDKVNNTTFSGRNVDRNFITLKNGVKRSLYRICTAFADYIQDFVENPEDLRLLMCFVNYQEA